MEDKIQLKHPKGKKAVRISTAKYETLKEALTGYLRTNSQGTYSEIALAIHQNFKTNNVAFDGAVNWYLEWVKLDLEANNVIRRIPRTSPQQYELRSAV